MLLLTEYWNILQIRANVLNLYSKLPFKTDAANYQEWFFMQIIIKTPDVLVKKQLSFFKCITSLQFAADTIYISIYTCTYIVYV